MDIYVVGAILFILLAMQYFKQAKGLQSTGYLLLGISSLLFSVSIILLKYQVSLLPVVVIVGFIIYVIGDGILMTQEKHISEAFMRQPFYKRLLGMLPSKAEQDAIVDEEKKSVEVKQKSDKMPMSLGITSVMGGIMAYLWTQELIFPSFIVASGLFVILLGKYYNRKKRA